MASIQEYIKYRVERSKELFEDTVFLAERQRWRSSVNRLYYSCFQLVDELMYADGITSKTHEGLKTIFFNNFIKTGKVDKRFGKIYSQLIDWRHESDYSIYVNFSKEDIIPLITKVEEFHKEILKQLQKHT